MEIEEIRINIAEGKYLIKTHAIQHAVKEGFERRNMIEAIDNGKIIESYLYEQRVLICGKTKLNNEVSRQDNVL